MTATKDHFFKPENCRRMPRQFYSTPRSALILRQNQRLGVRKRRLCEHSGSRSRQLSCLYPPAKDLHRYAKRLDHARLIFGVDDRFAR